jgi:hypothetical protein
MPKIVLPGDRKLYHGVFPGGPDGEENEPTPDRLVPYEAKAGRKVAWVYFSHEWSKGRAFPEATVRWIHWYGAAPFIRLMLRSSTEKYAAEPCYRLESIAAGGFKDDLAAWGKAAARVGFPLIAEWGTEMNGDWFSWNGKYHGMAAGTELFQNAYRNIVSTTRDAGATNVTWVFHVDQKDSPAEDWNKFENYDPGPDYTDWIGVSLYGAQTPKDVDWPDFSKRMTELYPRFVSLKGNRPIMVCEFGFTAGNPRGKPGPWAEDALDSLLSNKWPRIKGFSWWNEAWTDKDDGRTEMRLQCVKELADVFLAKIGNNKNVVDRPLSA